MNLYKKINAVMQAVEYVKKDAVIQGYKAVTHDQVTAAVRPAMVENSLMVTQSLISSEMQQAGQTGKGTPIWLYKGLFDVRFIDCDTGDHLSVTVEGQALDHGDKAAGKAQSYAMKYALLKTFCLETGENEESRQEIDRAAVEQKQILRNSQEAKVKKLIDETESNLDQVLAFYKSESIEELTETQLSSLIMNLAAKKKKEEK